MATNFYERLISKYEPLTEAEFLTLVSVQEPILGAALPAKIAALTRGQLQLGMGTLFTNLHAMTQDYLIKESVDAHDQHSYVITGSGQAVLAAEANRLRLLSQICAEARI